MLFSQLFFKTYLFKNKNLVLRNFWKALVSVITPSPFEQLYIHLCTILSIRNFFISSASTDPVLQAGLCESEGQRERLGKVKGKGSMITIPNKSWAKILRRMQRHWMLTLASNQAPILPWITQLSCESIY